MIEKKKASTLKNLFADIPYIWTSFLHFIICRKYVESIVEIASLLVSQLRHRFLSSPWPIFIALDLISISLLCREKKIRWVVSLEFILLGLDGETLFSCQTIHITHGFYSEDTKLILHLGHMYYFMPSILEFQNCHLCWAVCSRNLWTKLSLHLTILGCGAVCLVEQSG